MPENGRPTPRLHLHENGKVLSIGFEDGRGDVLLAIEDGLVGGGYSLEHYELYPDGDMARLRDWVEKVKVAIGRSELPPDEQALTEAIFLLSAGADWQRRAEGAEARLDQLEKAIVEYLVSTEFPLSPPAARLREVMFDGPTPKGELLFSMVDQWREVNAGRRRP